MMLPRLFLIIGVVVMIVGCKTPAAGSGLKDTDDITAGMNVHKGVPTFNFWRDRMGIVFEEDGGLRVKQAKPAFFASVIGLAAGDVVQTLNGKSVASMQDFEDVVDSFASGKSGGRWDGVWIFTVERGGKTKSIQAQAGYDCDPYVLAECGALGGPR